MSETAILGIAGLLATLFGVWLGDDLRRSAERHSRLRDAAEAVIVSCLEGAAHLEMVEVERGGGPAAPPIRAELARDSFGAFARVGA